MLELNLAIVFIATAGVLGRYIDMAPPLTIWFRTFFGSLIIALVLSIKGGGIQKILSRSDRKTILICGLFFTAHWITFFYALKWSNVAIALLSVFTYPVTTALIEPIILKTRFDRLHLWMALVILVGLYFLSPGIDWSDNIFLGLVMGLISGTCYAIRNVLVKRVVTRYNNYTLMFYHLAIGGIILLPTTFFYSFEAVNNQWPFLLMLIIVPTILGHALLVSSFKYFSITTASIMSSLQPIYGIFLAYLFLGETPESRTFIGGIIIISVALIEGFRKR